MSNQNRSDSKIIPLVIGGVVGGTLVKWLMDHERQEACMSRSERESPESVAEVLGVLDPILDNVSFTGDFKNERHIMNGLARHLKRKTEFEIEVEPTTPFGKPDILINAVVALELKKGLKKTEMDRCVGQSAGFSRQWFTIVLIFDAPASRVQMLANLLEDKNLDYIPVVHFANE